MRTIPTTLSLLAALLWASCLGGDGTGSSTGASTAGPGYWEHAAAMRGVAAVTCLHLDADGTASITLALDGMPPRRVFSGTWHEVAHTDEELGYYALRDANGRRVGSELYEGIGILTARGAVFEPGCEDKGGLL